MTGQHISLFSGVGMTDLAAEHAGFKTIATAEVDPFCQTILKLRFPDAWHYDDVAKIQVWDDDIRHASAHPGPLLVSGGFPCQDVSPSGTAMGLDGERSGLWREFRRVIKEFKPEYVLGENSSMLRSRGLATILDDLTDLGYHVRWETIPAAYVGAPHMRDRVWIMAKLWDGTPDSWLNDTGRYIALPDRGQLPRAGIAVGQMRWERTPLTTRREARLRAQQVNPGWWPTPTKSDGSGGPGTTPKREGGKNLRTAVAEIEGNGRLNPVWVEWKMGLPAGWTNPRCPNGMLVPFGGWEHEPAVARTVAHNLPHRSKRIRALGNDLVPQVAEVALKILMEGA